MAHGHDHHDIDVNKLHKFDFDDQTRKIVFGFIGGGVVLIILGLILSMMGGGGEHKPAGEHHSSAASVIKLASYTPEDTVVKAEKAKDKTKAAKEGEEEFTDHKPDSTHSAATESHGDGHGNGHGDAHATVAPGAHGGGHGEAHADEHHDDTPLHGPAWLIRLLSNLLIGGFMFTAMAGAAVFFLAVKNVSNAGWYTGFKRIPEAMGHFLFVGSGLLLITFLAGSGYLFEWTNEDIVNNDPTGLLQTKTWYLTKPFFLIRSILYFGIWIGFLLMLVKASKMEDEERSIKWFDKRVGLSALFIVVFALTFSSASWDWMMSVEAHWFSTMFSVHCFASAWAASLAMLTLIAIYLKERGYMPHLTIEHFHDLARFVFGFSIFWTYIWFCEFLLIWYANIPEEGGYFYRRLADYPVLFFANFIINFVLPFLILMSRANNRHLPVLGGVCGIVIFGHFIDFYLMVMPGTMHSHGGFGLMEIGTLVFFTGIFLFVTARVLSGMNIIPKNDPYLKESLRHEVFP